MNVGLRAQKTASAGPTEYSDLFSDDGRPAGGGSGRRHCLSRGRSRGFSGTPWSTPSKSVPSCRSSMRRCRMWGTRCWISCRRSMRRRLTSRLSPCPRSLWIGFRSALRVARPRRAEQKCLRSYPFLLCSSGLPSRSSTLQFLRVVAIVVAGEGSTRFDR